MLNKLDMISSSSNVHYDPKYYLNNIKIVNNDLQSQMLMIFDKYGYLCINVWHNSTDK